MPIAYVGTSVTSLYTESHTCHQCWNGCAVPNQSNHRYKIIWLSLISIAIIFAACQPTTQSSSSIRELPTLIPTPTVPVDMTSAQRVVMNFFDAWQRYDMLAMHEMLSFASQEANPFETFQRAYEDTHNLMTLSQHTIQPLTMYRETDRMVVMSYNVTFETEILGTFVDEQREMRVVVDPVLGDWRIAWSIADIFAEMGDGAVLRFEARVPSRANIYDRNGQVLADQNGVIVRVNVIPEDMPNREVCLPLLADVTGKSIEDVQDLFNRSGQNWVVDVGTMEPIAYELRHPELERDCDATFSQQATRRYPRGSLASHLIGNVGYPSPDQVTDLIRAGFNQETIIGQSGIERTWDDTLRGKPGGRLVIVATNGERIRTLAEVQTQIPESLWLTIDADLQEYTLRTLGEAYLDASESWAPASRGSAAVVLDVNTGEVLAMASYPTYDGNAFNPFPAIGRETANLILEDVGEDRREPLLNRATVGAYPSGSIMKVVPAIASLDSGLYDFDYTYFSTGQWTYENDTRFDWLAGGHGRVTLADALTVSCNTCFYEAGFQLNQYDAELLPNYARAMGLGEITGINAVAEAPGIIPFPQWVVDNRSRLWGYSDAVNMAIGQGEVQVTPLQMARLYGGIANGGNLYKPQLVRETGILDQRTFVAEPEINGTFGVTSSILDFVHDGLCAVTTANSGTASHIFRNSPLLSVGVCGKTGTAQAGVVGAAPHSWFIAYAPANDPEIVVAVLVENAGDGSAVAAPLTRRLMEYYFFGPFD